MADLIDRQAAIDAIMERFAKSIARQQALDVIQNLPTAERVGKWEAVGKDLICSECKALKCASYPYFNYCPNCGARMEVKTMMVRMESEER